MKKLNLEKLNLYFNYFPEILFISITFLFSIQNEDTISSIIISVFTIIFVINILIITGGCGSFDEAEDEALSIIFILFVSYIIINQLFKEPINKENIIFFHIFSGLISVAISIIIFIKNKKKNNYDIMMIIFTIIYLSYLIITPIVIKKINAYCGIENSNKNILNDSTDNNTKLIENKEKDNQNNNNFDNNRNCENNNEYNSNYNKETKNDDNRLYDINYNEFNNNKFNYSINNAITADMLNLNSNFPSKEEIDNKLAK